MADRGRDERVLTVVTAVAVAVAAAKILHFTRPEYPKNKSVRRSGGDQSPASLSAGSNGREFNGDNGAHQRNAAPRWPSGLGDAGAGGRRAGRLPFRGVFEPRGIERSRRARRLRSGDRVSRHPTRCPGPSTPPGGSPLHIRVWRRLLDPVGRRRAAATACRFDPRSGANHPPRLLDPNRYQRGPGQRGNPSSR